jgi:hypothetical protein
MKPKLTTLVSLLAASVAFAGNGGAYSRYYTPAPIKTTPAPAPVVVPAKPAITITAEMYFRIRESQYLELARRAQTEGDEKKASRFSAAASVQVLNRTLYADILSEVWPLQPGELAMPAYNTP